MQHKEDSRSERRLEQCRASRRLKLCTLSDTSPLWGPMQRARKWETWQIQFFCYLYSLLKRRTFQINNWRNTFEIYILFLFSEDSCTLWTSRLEHGWEILYNLMSFPPILSDTVHVEISQFFCRSVCQLKWWVRVPNLLSVTTGLCLATFPLGAPNFHVGSERCLRRHD